MDNDSRVITPSQTVGPFFSLCLTRPGSQFSLLGTNRLVTADAVGTPIVITGTVTDGEGRPAPDAMIEIWQADGQGRYGGFDREVGDGAFTGFGRAECDSDGAFSIETVKPGRVATLAARFQAPHIALGIFGKGLNRRLYTRLYFDDEPSNDEDPVLTSIAQPRRKTLIARATGPGRYEFLIRLQGKGETVFLEA